MSSRRSTTRWGSWLWVAILALACQPGGGATELKPVDQRYRALWKAPAEAAELELRFESRKGWHIVPDATAHLELAAPEGYALARPVQRGEDALEHSEVALAFALSLDRVASGPTEPGPLPLRGSVKFGICRDDATVCEIVRRDLALPAPVPTPSG